MDHSERRSFTLQYRLRPPGSRPPVELEFYGMILTVNGNYTCCMTRGMWNFGPTGEWVEEHLPKCVANIVLSYATEIQYVTIYIDLVLFESRVEMYPDDHVDCGVSGSEFDGFLMITSRHTMCGRLDSYLSVEVWRLSVALLPRVTRFE